MTKPLELHSIAPQLLGYFSLQFNLQQCLHKALPPTAFIVRKDNKPILKGQL
jgi:hypothetical protein